VSSVEATGATSVFVPAAGSAAGAAGRSPTTTTPTMLGCTMQANGYSPGWLNVTLCDEPAGSSV
jgi:hypothetical protein